MSKRYKHDPVIHTYSSGRLNFTNPSKDNICITDVAVGLGNTCRFGGQSEFYSVAEHSVYVAECAMDLADDSSETGGLGSVRRFAQVVGLLALLHDASEAYIGDVPTPMKERLDTYRTWEYALTFTLQSALMPQDWTLMGYSDRGIARALVKKADEQVLQYERHYVLGEPIEKIGTEGDTWGRANVALPKRPSVLPAIYQPKEATGMFMFQWRLLTHDLAAPDYKTATRGR